MFGVGDLIKSVSETEKEVRNYYLNVVDQNLQETSAASQAQSITHLIFKTKTRSIGLRFLIEYLPQCPNNILQDKANSWLTILIRACNKTEIGLYGELIFEALALLVIQIQAAPEIAKWFGATCIAKLYESLCLLEEKQTTTCCTISALKAVKQCLKYYPGHSKSGKPLVMRYLLTLIDSCCPEVIYQSGNCWLLLQQVRGSNDKKQWEDFQLGLLGSLNDLLSKAFHNYTNVNSISLSYKLDYFDVVLQGDPIQRAAQVSRRFCNLIEFLKIALSQPYPSAKLIRPKKILGFIQHGLEVRYANSGNNQYIDSICFGNLLPLMHMKLIELLEVLINICRTHLRIHFRLISGILLESLKKTQLSTPEGFPMQLTNLRVYVYKVTTIWLSTFSEGSGFDTIAERLVNIILEDIKTRRTDIYLMAKAQSKNVPKGKCKKKHYSILEPHFENTHIINNKRAAVCKQALRCLQKVLDSVGFLLKPPLLKVILATLLEISVQIYEKRVRIENTYNDSGCRLELYKSLFTFIALRNIPCSPPMDIIVYILDEAYKKDPSSDIRSTCKSMIALVENNLHPQREHFNFVEKDAQKSTQLLDEYLTNTEETKDQYKIDRIINNSDKEILHKSDVEMLSLCKSDTELVPLKIPQAEEKSTTDMNGKSEISPKNDDHEVCTKFELSLKPSSGDGVQHRKSELVSNEVNQTKCDDDGYIAELTAAFVDEFK